MDIHTVFLKEYAVQVHSKACFEASFCPLLFVRRNLSILNTPPYAPAPPPPPWPGIPGHNKKAPRSPTKNKKRASAHQYIYETKQPTASNFRPPPEAVAAGGKRSG